MRAVVGVDLGGMYRAALELCFDLEFPELELVLVHVVETIPDLAPPMEPAVLDSGAWIEHLRKAGDAALDEAAALATSRGVPCRTIVRDGFAAGVLEDEAEAVHADLIAIGSVRQSPLSRLLFGSVARGLTIGSRRSLLVARGGRPLQLPLRAIFATDHSEYAGRCFEKLLELHPRGLRSLDVATAIDFDKDAARFLEAATPELDGTFREYVEKRVQCQADELSRALIAAGYESVSRVGEGHPNRFLADLMKTLSADLLIVGAQGHGFLDRLFIGSVSLHQIAAEDYPVLVLRV